MSILTNRGTEYCGNRETHEDKLYLPIEDIKHSKIKAKSPQTTTFVSVSTEPCRMSSMELLSERKYIHLSNNCKMTLISG